MPKSCLFQNGKSTIAELSEVSIPATDSSFLFGDGVYEVVALVNGQFYDLAPHLDRLQKSLEIVGISAPMERSRMELEINNLLKVNNITAASSGHLYLQVSRDTQAIRDFAIAQQNTSSFFAYIFEQKIFPQQQPADGETALIFPDIRWALKHVKTTQLMSSRIAKKEAAKFNAADCIFINQKGIITEGGSTNLFIVKGNEIATHPADNAILAGITRKRVIELATEQGFKVVERKFTLHELLNADEVFRTSTTMGVRAISKIQIAENNPQIFSSVEPETIWQPQNIGQHQISNGLAGKTALTLSAAYAELARGEGKSASTKKPGFSHAM